MKKSIKSPTKNPSKALEVPVTQAMLFGVRDELRAEIKSEIRGIKEALLPSILPTILPSITNLFETQTVQMDKKLINLKSEIIHEVKILIDNDKRIETAIDLASKTNRNDAAIEDHSNRIEKLEMEVHAIKEAVKSPNY